MNTVNSDVWDKVNKIVTDAKKEYGDNINCYFLYTLLKKEFPDAVCLHSGNHVMTQIGNLIVDKDWRFFPIDPLEEQRFIERGLKVND